MLWLIPAIVGYFFKAASDAISKILLEDKQSIPDPIGLTFYTVIAGILVFALAPFGFHIPTISVFWLTFITGLVSTTGFFFLYGALARGEASRVITAIGAIAPVITFILARLFIGERFSSQEIIGLILVLIGVFIVGRGRSRDGNSDFFRWVVLAAVFFAFFTILVKAVFLRESFINGLIWIRFGALIGGMTFLFYKPWRKIIMSTGKMSKPTANISFLFAQVFSATSGILISFAILIGPVTLIVGLSGLEYIFLFLVLTFVSYQWPHILKEDISYIAIVKKLFGIGVVVAGILLMSISFF